MCFVNTLLAHDCGESPGGGFFSSRGASKVAFEGKNAVHGRPGPSSEPTQVLYANEIYDKVAAQ